MPRGSGADWAAIRTALRINVGAGIEKDSNQMSIAASRRRGKYVIGLIRIQRIRVETQIQQSLDGPDIVAFGCN
jgi:hypothetical protein